MNEEMSLEDGNHVNGVIANNAAKPIGTICFTPTQDTQELQFMTMFQVPSTENTSANEQLRQFDISYFQQRQRNRVFEQVIRHFAEKARAEHISKKHLAQKLGKDPSQITRWLAAPTNWTLDTISDLLLAMDAEMNFQIAPFSEQTVSNYFHPIMGNDLPIQNPGVHFATPASLTMGTTGTLHTPHTPQAAYE